MQNLQEGASSIRLAELMAALSLATDLGMGQPLEYALCSCVLAMRLGEALGLSEGELREVYYQALLRFIKGRVKPRALALGIKAALPGLTHTYHTWYHMRMKISDPKPIRWTLYAAPALIEQFRQLAALHRRSLNSELIWALEQYARAEQRKGKRDADPQSL